MVVDEVCEVEQASAFEVHLVQIEVHFKVAKHIQIASVAHHSAALAPEHLAERICDHHLHRRLLRSIVVLLDKPRDEVRRAYVEVAGSAQGDEIPAVLHAATHDL
eukprot:CAMPEP_0179977632 /NCGR_PEP_ID=MMETSP0983-20121128/40195_1 /TAXON_ID=483367 /ORGANISM="non described non described, Strain CCMP 2436" /LENGTH=104 /DNA_ID=CAMNT_0021894897 /DNA_START=192 /DNA_END=506 /DNA_ORIENTATION=-